MRKEGVVEEIGQARQEVEAAQELLLCPICNLYAAQLRRGKLHCGNCGFIES